KKDGMVFFGTHGINDAERPLNSHLMLMPAPPDDSNEADDGKLTAREVYGRRLKKGDKAPDLVVMSACYSGLGDRSPLPGDDLFGLQRAFLAAGARTVVAGLWDVSDETAPDLMKGMCVRLVKGVPAAAALADSQREFVRRLKASKDAELSIH